MLVLWIFVGAGLLFALQRMIYIRFWDRGLRLSLFFAEKAVTEGETVTLLERSENRKLLPLPVFGYRYVVDRNFMALTETGTKPMVMRRKLALPPHRAVVNRTAIQGLPRGVYTLSQVRCFGGDLFYTVELEKSGSSLSMLTVYPAKIPAKRLSLPFRRLLGAVLTRRMAQEDPFQLRNIRPYQVFDSPRYINWKASAKTGELKVNQFEYTTDEALLFLLDMESGSLEDREELIRLASSLSRLFLRRGVSVALRANCRSCVSGRPIQVDSGADAGHLLSLDAALAQIKLESSATESFPAFLAGLPERLFSEALPVVFSADPEGKNLRAYEGILGGRDACFMTLGARKDAARGIRIISWNPEEGEESA